jgi:SLBB domain
MRNYYYVIIIFFIGSLSLYGQAKDYELGADVMGLMKSMTQGGYYNYSDPEAVNIKVAVWGWVRYPGKYTVPSYTTVSDLLSYAGGPTDAAELEDLRIYRVSEDSTQSFLKFSYSDLLYDTKLQTKFRKVPKLEAGDILVVPGEPRLYFKDHLSIWLAVFSTLISLTILIFNIVKK